MYNYSIKLLKNVPNKQIMPINEKYFPQMKIYFEVPTSQKTSGLGGRLRRGVSNDVS